MAQKHLCQVIRSEKNSLSAAGKGGFGRTCALQNTKAAMKSSLPLSGRLLFLYFHIVCVGETGNPVIINTVPVLPAAVDSDGIAVIGVGHHLGGGGGAGTDVEGSLTHRNSTLADGPRGPLIFC